LEETLPLFLHLHQEKLSAILAKDVAVDVADEQTYITLHQQFSSTGTPPRWNALLRCMTTALQTAWDRQCLANRQSELFDPPCAKKLITWHRSVPEI